MNPPVMPAASDLGAESAPGERPERGTVEVRPNAKEFNLFAPEARTKDRSGYERAFGDLLRALKGRAPLLCRQSINGSTVQTTLTTAARGEVTLVVSGFIFVVRLEGPPESPASIVELVAVVPCT